MPFPSGPRSGKHAAVDGVHALRNWVLNITDAGETRYHSATAGGPERDTGVEDWTVSMDGFGGNPGFWLGDTVSLQLYAGPSTGVLGANGITWFGDAIVESLTINWNWQPGNSLNWSATFASQNCITWQDDYITDPGGLNCFARMCELFIEYESCAGGGFTVWDNIESATLTFTATNPTYVNSSTNCCTGRRFGNVDWTLDIVDQEDYPVMDNQDQWAFRLYDTPTTYWLLEWGQFKNLSNIRADVESAAIKTKTNNIVMNGRLCCGSGGSPTLGSIVDPDTDTLWPIVVVP